MLIISRAEALKLNNKSPELTGRLPEAAQNDKEKTPPEPGPAILSGLAYIRIPEALGAERGVDLAIGISPVPGIIAVPVAGEGLSGGVVVVGGGLVTGAGATATGATPITGISGSGSALSAML